jgi:ABC-type phosphate/phosphonate transport system permease subunit
MDSGSEEESVLDVGEEQLFEEDLEVDEFAETLKLIESNAEEIDQQLLDAISEVGGNIVQMLLYSILPHGYIMVCFLYKYR